MEGKTMTERHSAISARSQSALSQWLSTLGLRTTPQAPVDRPTLATWLREGKERRAQASTLAEKPPLLSY
jgi:hypothetical protein